jgi:hypothetical protein
VTYRDEAPEGKLDLVVDINFRMDTSALYSDIVLPTASWYEKDDLNTTDMHSFIHPLSAGGAALMGVEIRLGYFQNSGGQGQRTGADSFARTRARSGCHAAST